MEPWGREPTDILSAQLCALLGSGRPADYRVRWGEDAKPRVKMVDFQTGLKALAEWGGARPGGK